MDRIQNALQLHKKSQGKEVRQDSLIEPNPSSIPVPLVYTQTKTVTPSVSAMKAHRIVTTTQSGHFLEAYKILRTQIFHRLQEHRWNVIGVTSPGSAEGKTLVAANLAICVAMDPNHTALLVDGNLQHPTITSTVWSGK